MEGGGGGAAAPEAASPAPQTASAQNGKVCRVGAESSQRFHVGASCSAESSRLLRWCRCGLYSFRLSTLGCIARAMCITKGICTNRLRLLARLCAVTRRGVAAAGPGARLIMTHVAAAGLGDSRLASRARDAGLRLGDSRLARRKPASSAASPHHVRRTPVSRARARPVELSPATSRPPPHNKRGAGGGGVDVIASASHLALELLVPSVCSHATPRPPRLLTTTASHWSKRPQDIPRFACSLHAPVATAARTLLGRDSVAAPTRRPRILN